MCQNCFHRFIGNFLQRKKVLGERTSFYFFVGMWEKSFGTSGKKTQSSSEKVSWELRKLLSLLPKRMLEKRELFSGKKSAPMKLSDPSKNSDFLSEHFFSNFVGRLFQFFGVNFEVFFVENFFCFCSIWQFWDLRRDIFCSDVKTSF